MRHCLCFLDIHIGFKLPEYTFCEPDFETFINNVTIIKEDGQVTEQTFALIITINEPNFGIRPATRGTTETIAAGINYDFRTTRASDLVLFELLPDKQNLTFSFFLNSDELPEGTEGFLLHSEPVRGQPLGFSYPIYQPPSGINAQENAEILIKDDDST